MKTEIQMDHAQVMQILPHRSPMLLVDTVSACVPMEMIKSSLYIDPEWVFFQGHFPGNPVFPGVLSIEAMAQSVDIMLMTAERYQGKEPLFASIGQAKFRRKILPGNTVEMQAEVIEERPEKALITSRAEMYVNGELAAEAVITVAMR